MRTSRVSRETSRLVDALSPRATRLRNSLPSREIPNSPNRVRNASSPLSPSSSESVADPGYSSSSPSQSPAASSRKRKRAGNVPAAVIKEETVAITSTTEATRVKPKKARRQPAKVFTAKDGATKIEPPPNWERVYALTKEMRSRWPAPVDTMGCETLAEGHRSPRDQRFQTLVSLMLSSQTKDTVTSAAMKNMQQNLPGGLTLESILSVQPTTLNEMISKVGFHNNKTKYIKSAAEILRDRYASDIPSTIEGLVALPGVGPKMAYLCMSAAWGRDEGIGVDVHVHRITNLWGWHKTKDPEQTRALLESWLPKDRWHDINTVLVGFGQTWCPPVGKKCDECTLAAERLCPSAQVSGNVKKKVTNEVTVVKDEHGDNILEHQEALEVKIAPVISESSESDKDTTFKAAIPDIEDIGGPKRRSRRLGR